MRIFSPVEEADLAAAKKALKRPGTKLELVPAMRTMALDYDPSELNGWDNTAAIRVNVAHNPADSVAIGDNFEGKVGHTRTIKVGIRNDGPAISRMPGEKWKPSAKVRIPSGLKLTKVDKNCVPNGDGDPSWDQPGRVSGHDYLCVIPDFGLSVGQQQLFSFTAKIQDGKNEDEGSITVDGGVQDLKKANNVAKIEVKLPAAGGTGGTGGTGGGLPVTGTPTAQVAVAGLLLMLTGVSALVLTRRRQNG
jgi:LPXTG-motif cell wall-anchored protein